MHSRAARLMLLVLFLSALSVTSFLYWKGETRAEAGSAQAQVFDASVRFGARTLLDMRAAQQAYVAAGQGGDFWASKVAQGLDSLRGTIKALKVEATAPQAQSAIDSTASTLEDFARIDKRAVDYIRNGQRLLASDVIFADGLELTEAALTSLEQARASEMQAREAIVDTYRARQTFALTAGAAAAILTVVLLLPRQESERIPVIAGAERLTPRLPAEPPRPEPPPVDASGAAGEEEGWSPPRRLSPRAEAAAAIPASEEPTLAITMADVSELPAEQAAAFAKPPVDFADVAALCVDLARIVDTRSLPGLLDRAAALLDASGIILWIADPDGRELNPIFAQGYPPQLVNRLGTIPRDAENATAAAFRTSLLQTVRADEMSAGAIAAPLVTATGCVGVMAAEVRHDAERQDTMLAAAVIVAAQLATLVGPPAARSQSNHAKSAGA